MTEKTREETDIVVRSLRMEDLEDVIRIDAKAFGSPRRDYYRLKLEKALKETSVQISLAAEIDGQMVGFLMGSVFYGDFGLLEPQARIDAVGVLPDFSGRGVARAMWQQLTMNCKGMRIDLIQTEVAWSDWELVNFFHALGFQPSTRMVLERTIDFESDN